MVWVNTYVWERVPFERPPLPDAIMDLVEKYVGHRYPIILAPNVTDICSICGFVGAILCTVFQVWAGIGWEPMGRLALIHGILLQIRTVMFTSTSLTVPNEIGMCRQNPMPDLMSRWAAGLSWVFAFGFDGMKSAPQCGDLMPSGHTIFVMVHTLHFNRYLPQWPDWRITVFRGVMYTLASLAFVNIVLLRNHYTVDVVGSIIFTWLVFVVVHQNLDLYRATGVRHPLIYPYEPTILPEILKPRSGLASRAAREDQDQDSEREGVEMDQV
eukprot:CAMPEP_0177717498 /NCGR_PEP_ID=MMETSP0484_2-20121128/15076_1 /TAXON_ID=354590 /ORGANISM="Rhodomonas lens, Strain RHODO" /LENGTH=269 /DNA_ID=CAMNT_0019229601 /DNA_START=284 /DNA_END=1093 /DNA_ORIENTATION=-